MGFVVFYEVSVPGRSLSQAVTIKRSIESAFAMGITAHVTRYLCMPRCTVSHTGTANVLTARRLQGEKLDARNRSKAKTQRKGGISFLGMRCCSTSQTHSH